MGRPDLADAHRRIDRTDTALFWSQVVLTVGAFGFAVVAIFGEEPVYWIPAGASFGGALALGLWRGLTPPLPIGTEEAGALAEGYDRNGRSSPPTVGRALRIRANLVRF